MGKDIYSGKVNEDNNKKSFYSKYDSINMNNYSSKDNKSVIEKIDYLFKKSVMNYTKEVRVILNNGNVITTRFIKKIDNCLLTIDNDKIVIDSIKDIEY